MGDDLILGKTSGEWADFCCGLTVGFLFGAFFAVVGGMLA